MEATTPRIPDGNRIVLLRKMKTAVHQMIPPHGNQLVDRTLGAERSEEIKEGFDDMRRLELDKPIFFDFANIARGVYSPIKGFMTQNDFKKVVNDLALESGVPWTLPIVLDVGVEFADDVEIGERIGIAAPDGSPAGIMDIEEVYRYNEEDTCNRLFDTTNEDHPGVRLVQQKDQFFLGGEIKAFEEAVSGQSGYDLSPKEARVLFKKKGWDSVAGFQTRNVPHRAHEYLQKSSLEHVDGLFVQPKIGEKKAGDYTNEAIINGYETLIDDYYPRDSVVLSMFKSRMWYAGPREAVFDSIVRKNYGCTHFIIGRDHAGVGNYYEDFEAQRLFEDMEYVGIEPLYYHYAFFCRRCDGVVSEKVCPHDAEERIEPSGTELRGMLSTDEKPSEKLMRPEVTETVLELDGVFVGD